ncbi:MAG TPA: hypothetical protein VHI52_07165, partial [Verrucomicrobiae bacterium]|nr:hypothetical protein [Verrucomicrobiae bacterium]
NVAQMGSLKELWKNMPFESFPALWLLILRAWSFLGLGHTDLGIRSLGLIIGLGCLGSTWWSARLLGARAPTLSVALYALLPAFVSTATANRAYGLAMCLTVLVFALIWRLVERPTLRHALWTGLACVLYAQCLYYDALFLGAMLFGGALVLLRRRDWRTIAVLITIGVCAGLSMVIYLPTIQRGSAYGPISQVPFDLWALCTKLGQAATFQSSAGIPGPPGAEVWVWLAATALGLGCGILFQLPSARADSIGATASLVKSRADLALFSGTSLVLGVTAYGCFLLKLSFPTQPWYYMVPFALVGVTLDALLNAAWQNRNAWGVLRSILLIVMAVWSGSALWEEAHIRRSNIDLIAKKLETGAKPGDLILVQSAYEGITFDRYYKGRVPWMTIPPIQSHKVHRNDLLWEKLHESAPMSSVLEAIKTTVAAGGRVWFVGPVPMVHPGYSRPPLPPAPNLPTKWWLPPYMESWAEQAVSELVQSGRSPQKVEVPVNGPVNHLENLPLTCF